MEEKYWEQFMRTGGLTDYLAYKMELYGHAGDQDAGDRVESDYIDRNGALNDTDWRI